MMLFICPIFIFLLFHLHLKVTFVENFFLPTISIRVFIIIYPFVRSVICKMARLVVMSNRTKLNGCWTIESKGDSQFLSRDDHLMLIKMKNAMKDRRATGTFRQGLAQQTPRARRKPYPVNQGRDRPKCTILRVSKKKEE